MDLFQQFAAVMIVLAMLIGVLWILRARPALRGRPGQRGPAARLQCVDRLALTHQHSLHLVRIGTQFLVIGLGPGTMSLIREMGPDPALSAEEPR